MTSRAVLPPTPAGRPPSLPLAPARAETAATAGVQFIGWTLCSGIGAPEIGCPEIDWRLASEIEPFPRSVLAARFGHEDRDGARRRLWGDFTALDAAAPPAPLPDVIVAGTPCQAFSVAGARRGLEDARGNLTLAFVDLCHAIAARNDGGLVAVWENVPGVLSDAGNAFGCFLGGLVGADDPLRTPDGGSWPGVGMVAGPRARVAWRVLDAQYFGVAQRRRRVFLVADIGNGADPAAILFERKGVRGNTPPRRKTREDVAADAGAGFEVSSGDVAHCLNAGGMGRQDFEPETLIACATSQLGAEVGIAPSLRAEPGGLGYFMNVLKDGGAAPAIRAASGGSTRPMVAFDPNQITSKANRSIPSGEICHTIPGTPTPPMLALDLYNLLCTGDVAATLATGPGGTAAGPSLTDGYAIRRLLPTECEALQGFPRNHTAVMHRGKPAADGPRYKALGNSWAVPCGRWVLSRVIAEMRRVKG